MARMVNCIKLGREAPGLKYKPFPGELGQKLYDNVSEEGFRTWLEHSKMIINEYRLDLMSPTAQKILAEQCDKFFWGEGVALPPEYKAQH